MNNDEKYAEAHRLEGIMKSAEVAALEAAQKAGIMRAKSELCEVYGEANDAYLMADKADRLDRIARIEEDEAEDAYEAWAKYCSENNL